MKKKILIAVMLFTLPITMLKASDDYVFELFGSQSKDVENRDRATWTESDIDGLTAEEEEAPLGEGIALLIAGGLGYAFLKRKGEKE